MPPGNFTPSMSPLRCCLFFLAGALVAEPLAAQNHADRIIAYQPGIGAGSLTNAQAALGPPSRETVDPQWGTFPVDPFGPPYLSNQVVSIGAGGSLTLRFEHPVENHPDNPHGLDFIVFGNAFFQFKPDFSTTSGALGGTNSGLTTLSISTDGTRFFPLDPNLAPHPDTLFPTDGVGDPTVPVDPTLTGSDFAGRDLAGIRALYAGGAGGAGYDIKWARDDTGNPVNLPFVRYLRFDQIMGDAQIDAVSAISTAPTWHEDFLTDPAARRWKAHGQESLFAWNATTSKLEVTWDSSQPNSFYHRPLGTVLGIDDNFALGFALQLDALTVGPDPTKPYTFQLALALMQWEAAVNPAFHRGAGIDPTHGPRNLVEFAYFPDSGFGATISPSMISDANQFATSLNFPLELTLGDRFDVTLRYLAADRTLRTEITRNYMPFSPIQDIVLPPDFSSLQLDAIAICSYSDEGQHPDFGGSILARGQIESLRLFLPDPPVRQLTLSRQDHGWQAEFSPRPGWSYALERTVDFLTWESVATRTSQSQETLTLTDSTPLANRAFYRVRAEKP
jgi:hypothetical protein